MPNLLETLKSAFSGDPAAVAPPEAPDGSREELKSGKWPTHQVITPDAFPAALLLTEQDRSLSHKLGTQVVLQSARVGKHTVELILSAGSENTVDLSLRVPTAANQFKEPYILLEAESGNTREDAVREICFHLQGRVQERDVKTADWAAFFKSAASKLETLRR